MLELQFMLLKYRSSLFRRAELQFHLHCFLVPVYHRLMDCTSRYGIVVDGDRLRGAWFESSGQNGDFLLTVSGFRFRFGMLLKRIFTGKHDFISASAVEGSGIRRKHAEGPHAHENEHNGAGTDIE